MTDYTIEYYSKDAMENVPTEHHDFVVMVNGKGGLKIAGYVSRELAEHIKTLHTAASKTA